MNILHLSDIHFGRDKSGINEVFAKKREILDSLIEYIVSLEKCFYPDIVLVTGDIAWRGKASEFDEAYEWFQRLRETLGLQSDQIVFCPGNHDLNRNVAVDFSEESLQMEANGKKVLSVDKCDDFYRYENAHMLEGRFNNYNTFCWRMGMQPYSYKLSDGTEEYSYLVGSNHFEFDGKEYRIVSFNTAYLPYGKVLKDDQMFLGLPQIEKMYDDGIFGEKKDRVYRIALFHHAERYLHPNEQCQYDGRKATLSLLLNSVDLALCGHTETGGMPILRTYQDGGSILCGGATYYNDDHPNSFSIVRIEKGREPELSSHYYDGISWRPYREMPVHWENSHPTLWWENAVSETENLCWGIYIDGSLKVFNPSNYTVEYYNDGRTIKRLHNRMDPSRGINIDIKNESGKAVGLPLRHAPAQEQRPFSLSEIAAFNAFVNEHINDAHKASILWYKDGNFNYAAYELRLDISEMKAAQGRQPYDERPYKLLMELEEFFDVGFKIPTSVEEEEQKAVRWLHEIMERGSLNLSVGGIESSDIYVHNLQELQWLWETVRLGEPMAYCFRRKIKFRLFGTEIDLGECELYFVGAVPKSLDEIERKLKTWEEGDVRRVETFFPDDISFWIVRETCIEPKEWLKGKRVVDFPEDAPLHLNEILKHFIYE